LAENGGDLYPDVLNTLIMLFKVHETGDLTVPTIGTVRARAVSYSRREAAEKRDYAEVTFTWCEDNEDNVDAAAFQLPTVSSNAEALVEAAEFDEQSNDMWDGSLADLNELAAQLEGLANAPETYKQDFEAQTNIIKGSVDKIIDAHSKPLVDGRDTLLDPEGQIVERHLQAIKDLAGQAQKDGARGRPATVTRFYTSQLSIFQVAVIESQDANVLLTINPQLEDMLQIPAGTGVRILASG
jgi:hypothetical protein